MRRLAALAVLSLAWSASSVIAAEITPAPFKAAPNLTPWTTAISFDLVTLERRKGTGIPLALGLSSSDFDMSRSPSADVKIEIGFAGAGIEARYLGHFEFADQRSTTITALFTNPNINFGARLVPFQYSSSLDSWEVNAFWRVFSRLKVFAGYREFRIDEILTADLTGASFAVAADNRLAGFQAGLAARIFEGVDIGPSLAGLYGDVGGRLGRYRNSATLSHLPVGVGGAVASRITDSADTMVVELEAKIGYALSRNVDVHLGYRYLRFDRVLLAAENYTSVNIVTGTGAPVYTTAEYQGFFAGIQAGF